MISTKIQYSIHGLTSTANMIVTGTGFVKPAAFQQAPLQNKQAMHYSTNSDRYIFVFQHMITCINLQVSCFFFSLPFEDASFLLFSPLKDASFLRW